MNLATFSLAVLAEFAMIWCAFWSFLQFLMLSSKIFDTPSILRIGDAISCLTIFSFTKKLEFVYGYKLARAKLKYSSLHLIALTSHCEAKATMGTDFFP